MSTHGSAVTVPSAIDAHRVRRGGVGTAHREEHAVRCARDVGVGEVVVGQPGDRAGGRVDGENRAAPVLVCGDDQRRAVDRPGHRRRPAIPIAGQLGEPISEAHGHKVIRGALSGVEMVSRVNATDSRRARSPGIRGRRRDRRRSWCARRWPRRCAPTCCGSPRRARGPCHDVTTKLPSGLTSKSASRRPSPGAVSGPVGPSASSRCGWSGPRS